MRTCRKSQAELLQAALADIGADPLDGSGFEKETPEGFPERMEIESVSSEAHNAM
jgi:hypothetical protein